MAKKKPDDPTQRLLDELTKDATAAELIKDGSVLKDLKRRLVEAALEAEMTDHLGYEKHSPDGHGTGNSRNCHHRPHPRQTHPEHQPLWRRQGRRTLGASDQESVRGAIQGQHGWYPVGRRGRDGCTTSAAETSCVVGGCRRRSA